MKQKSRVGKQWILVCFWLVACTSTQIKDGKPERIIAHEEEVRAVYPYSLIEGGVGSAAEFQQVRTSTPVLDRHYSDVGFHVREAILPQDQLMYSSWRRGSEVYWTQKRILVHKGESVLTDGVNLIRARCGNRLSETPPSSSATSPDEPAEIGADVAIVLPPWKPESLPSILSEISVPQTTDTLVKGETAPMKIVSGTAQGNLQWPPFLFSRVPYQGPISAEPPSLVTHVTPEPAGWQIAVLCITGVLSRIFLRHLMQKTTVSHKVLSRCRKSHLLRLPAE